MFTVAVFITFALGISANATMLSVVNRVLPRPLSGYPTDRLMQICDIGRGPRNYLAPETYERLREELRSFATTAVSQNRRSRAGPSYPTRIGTATIG